MMVNYLLSEEYTLGGERLGQHHALLEVHVVVRRSVDQVEQLVSEQLGTLRHVRLVIPLVVGGHVR